MRKKLTAAERLIVAADYDLGTFSTMDIRPKRIFVKGQVLKLARDLPRDTCIKLNSVARALGYDLVDRIHDQNIQTFLDFKLVDIGATMANDGKFIREVEPAFLTVMLNANLKAIKALKDELPTVAVLGVGVPSDWKEEDCMRVYDCDIAEETARLQSIGLKAGVDGFICAPAEASATRTRVGDDLWVITPNVRFQDSEVAGDDQNANRGMSPGDAIKAGADAVVMGRPITQNKLLTPREAALKAIEEMKLVAQAA